MLPLACVLALAVALAWSSPAAAHTFGGRAYSAYVNIPGTLLVPGVGPLYIADTGALAPDGGWNGATLMDTSVPGVLTAETLVAATSGALTDTAGTQVNSSTALANVVLLPGQAAEITAAFVRAQADSTDAGPGGYSQIDGLTFGGVPVQVTGLPNQTVSLPGVATLIINEQTATAQGIVVNALHLILATGGEIIVSSARSSISQ